MAKNIVKSVNTKGVSFGPILRYYFNRCAIAEFENQKSIQGNLGVTTLLSILKPKRY